MTKFEITNVNELDFIKIFHDSFIQMKQFQNHLNLTQQLMWNIYRVYVF